MELAFLCIGNSVLKWFIALLPLDPCVSFSFSFFPLVWALDIFSEDFIFIYSKQWDNVFFLPFFTVSQWKYLIVYTWRKKKKHMDHHLLSFFGFIDQSNKYILNFSHRTQLKFGGCYSLCSKSTICLSINVDEMHYKFTWSKLWSSSWCSIFYSPYI